MEPYTPTAQSTDSVENFAASGDQATIDVVVTSVLFTKLMAE